MTYEELEAAWQAAGRPGWFTRWVSATYGDAGMKVLADITHAAAERVDPERSKRWYLGEHDGIRFYYLQDRPSALIQPQPGDRLEWEDGSERYYAPIEEGKYIRAPDLPSAVCYRLAHEKGLC